MSKRIKPCFCWAGWYRETWLARAIALKACRGGYTALFRKAAELFRDLATARADGSHSKRLDQLGPVDVLIVDCFYAAR